MDYILVRVTNEDELYRMQQHLLNLGGTEHTWFDYVKYHLNRPEYIRDGGMGIAFRSHDKSYRGFDRIRYWAEAYRHHTFHEVSVQAFLGEFQTIPFKNVR